FRLGAEPALDADYIPEEVDLLPHLAGQLGAAGQKVFREAITGAVRDVRRPARRETFKECWARISDRYLAVSRLDAQLRSALRDQPAPEPLLVLDRESITFLGEQRPFAAYPETEMAILWVLAERARTPVPRQIIRGEGRIQTPEHQFAPLLTRLR